MNATLLSLLFLAAPAWADIRPSNALPGSGDASPQSLWLLLAGIAVAALGVGLSYILRKREAALPPEPSAAEPRVPAELTGR